ncbi:MAG: hypothetical protein P4L51_14530 [Puia sp.]|nr:hypothetical protein [Puia sp.]
MRYLTMLWVLLICTQPTFSQDQQDLTGKAVDFPSRFFTKINQKTVSLDDQLTRQTEKYLTSLSRKERRLKTKLYAQDSAKAAALYGNDPQQQYAAYIQKLKNDSSRIVHSMGPEYLPYADSLRVSLAFLNKNPQLFGAARALPAGMQNSLAQLQQLQAKLLDADEIKQFIQQRKEQIRQCLLGYESPPPGANGILDNYNKQLYYYSVQVRQYREDLNDPGKMLQEALSVLCKLPAFASFMKTNSFLAGLFGVPSNYGSPDALTGMQTRDQVLSMIQNQVGSGGPSAAGAVQSSLQTASQDITNMQNKISSMGAGGGTMDMPNFKPQNVKTKTFFQRLEYGTNVQTQSSAYYYPVTTDLGLSIAYKMTDQNTIGLGASYKIGFGSSFQHASLSSQGIGLRSFANIQAKKSFFLSGGFEYNYQPVQSDLSQTLALKSWSQSGLIGVSKIVSMKTRVFKKTNLQLLWDFLSADQVPRTQPFKFRVGYSF